MTCDEFGALERRGLHVATNAECLAAAKHYRVCDACRRRVDEAREEAEKNLDPATAAAIRRAAEEQVKRVASDPGAREVLG